MKTRMIFAALAAAAFLAPARAELLQVDLTIFGMD
jgi:hypothetical protein